MSSKKLKTRELTLIALFAALIAVTAVITIPAPVPITLQTFGIFLAINTLGGKKGTAAILLYIAIGAVGLPVFSGGSGGIGVLFGKTGGYLLGFVLSGVLAWLAEKLPCRSALASTAVMALGLLLSYTLGTAWYIALYRAGEGGISLKSALYITVLPFIIPDMIKLALAAAVGKRLSKIGHY